MEPHRVVEVYCPGGGKVGSGYLTTGRTVLTAWHVVQAAGVGGPVEIRPLRDGEHGGRFYRASVVWPTADELPIDAALLVIDDPEWRPGALEPVRFGRVTGDAEVPVVGLGFPDAARVPETSRRDTLPVRGHIEPLAHRKSAAGHVVVALTGPLVPARPMALGAPDDDAPTSPWAGMSGAALFQEDTDVLLAIVTTDHDLAMDARTLLATPVSALAATERFAASAREAGLDAAVQIVTSRPTANARMHHSGTGEGFKPPFLVVDPVYLAHERNKPKVPFIARPPVWADVVHGENADSRFLEREQLGALLSAIDRQLLDPLHKGSDRRLHTLFVIGSPGCGKSTLVRHAAATLVERGDVVVADLGVNQGRLILDDLDMYLKGLAQLAAYGQPVLLLMDDPFFANSDWERLLETLARPSYSGIAVLGASPTYLYDAYTRRLSGGQIALNKFVLGDTTNSERQSLAEMYGVRSRPAIDRAIDRHKELLVFAMETASGNSFGEIIERIWSTLNDGRKIGETAVIADVEWPVLAFLLTSNLHRRYVACPESLLREYLAELAGDARSEFIDELTGLTLSEGWHIFRVSRTAPGTSRQTMIGTMHARVAERAWQLRPFRAVDQTGLLARASARAPDCAPQLAEFILAGKSKDPADRQLLREVAEQWRDGRVSTAELSALVRGLHAAQPALAFRAALRERVNRRDSQSWLAVNELIRLERPGSPARERLVQDGLPAALNLADLSADSSMAIALIGSNRSPQAQKTAARLRAALSGTLTGDPPWELDSRLLLWLLHNLPSAEIHAMLPQIHDWFDAHPKDERTRVELVDWHAAEVVATGSGEIDQLVDRAREWVSVLPDGRSLISAFIGLAAAMLESTTGPLPTDLIEEISAWLESRPDDAELRVRLLRFVAQNRAQVPRAAATTIAKALSWPDDDPDADGVRQALLDLVLTDPDHPDAVNAVSAALGWLAEHPADSRTRVKCARLLKSMPAVAVAELVTGILAGLAEAQDDTAARRTLWVLAHLLSHHTDYAAITELVYSWLDERPDDGRARSAFLGLLRELPQLPGQAHFIERIRQWLLSHPDDASVRGSLLALIMAQPGQVEDVAEALAQSSAWLVDRPDDEDGHLQLIKLALRVPQQPQAAQALALSVRRLDGHRGRTETWIALFGLVRSVPGNPWAAEVCDAARRWLVEHPDDAHVRTSLLGFIRTMPRMPRVVEVVGETFDWLDRNPDENNVPRALSRLIRSVAHGVVKHGRPAPADVDSGDLLAPDRPPGAPQAREAAELITRVRRWLHGQPENVQMREALLRLVAAVPRYSQTAELATEARQWLTGHPDDVHVRTGLLGLVKALPNFPQATEVIAEVLDWLDRHPDQKGVRAALEALPSARYAALTGRQPSRVATITGAQARLTQKPNDRNARVRLLAMVREQPDNALREETVAETRQWLDAHPEDSHTRFALLSLLRAFPEYQHRSEVIAEALEWLEEHVGDLHLRTGLLRLTAAFPDSPHAAEIVVSTLRWLDEHPERITTRLLLLKAIREHQDRPHALEAIAQSYDWLTTNDPRDGRVASSLRALIRTLPESMQIATATVKVIDWLDEHRFLEVSAGKRRAQRMPEPAIRPEPPRPEELRLAQTRLTEQPDDADARVHVLALAREVPGQPYAATTMAEVRQWLAGHPDQVTVRVAAFQLGLLLPDNPDAAELILETFTWVTSDPSNRRLTMNRFFSALSDAPGHRAVGEVIGAARRWLADSPDSVPYRPPLLGLVRAAPQSPDAADVVMETRLWLFDHPDDTLSRAGLLSLLRALPDYPETVEVVQEARSWLAGRPQEIQVREALLALVRILGDHQEALDVVSETRHWLAAHPEIVQVRFALLCLIRGALPHTPQALAIALETQQWLTTHPDAVIVREALLLLVHALPANPPLAEELLTQTVEWFRRPWRHTHDARVLRVALLLATTWPGTPAAEAVAVEAHRWLLASSNDTRYAQVLTGLVVLAKELPKAEFREEVTRTARDWLNAQPDTTDEIEALRIAVQATGSEEHANRPDGL